MTGKNVHRMGTAVLSLSMALIGLVLIAQAATGGGGIVLRLLLGVLFLAGGCGRLYILMRGRRSVQGRRSVRGMRSVRGRRSA